MLITDLITVVIRIYKVLLHQNSIAVLCSKTRFETVKILNFSSKCVTKEVVFLQANVDVNSSSGRTRPGVGR